MTSYFKLHSASINLNENTTIQKLVNFVFIRICLDKFSNLSNPTFQRIIVLVQIYLYM